MSIHDRWQMTKWSFALKNVLWKNYRSVSMNRHDTSIKIHVFGNKVTLIKLSSANEKDIVVLKWSLTFNKWYLTFSIYDSNSFHEPGNLKAVVRFFLGEILQNPLPTTTFITSIKISVILNMENIKNLEIIFRICLISSAVSDNVWGN